MIDQNEVIPISSPMERTFFTGYSVAASIAFAVFQFTDMVWQGGVLRFIDTVWQGGAPSRSDIDIILVFDLFMLLPVWFAVIIPFIVVQYFRGARGFASPGQAAAWGGVVGLLTMPFGFRLMWIAAFESPYHSFGVDLMWTVEHRAWLFALSGAVAGLAYWGLEFSRGPTMLVALIARLWRLVGRRG